MIQTFKKKPVEVHTVQWDGSGKSYQEISAWTGNQFHLIDLQTGIAQGCEGLWGDEYNAVVWDHTHSAWLGVKPNEWIIEGLEGEFYPCGPATFETIYEKVERPMLDFSKHLSPGTYT